MPSEFLETFGLVALESLHAGIPVIGYKKGGVIPFIHDRLALDLGDSVGSCIRILQEIFAGTIEKKAIHDSFDLSPYSLSAWRKNLQLLLEEMGDPQRILIVNDYMLPIGGAEVYTFFLISELEKAGKEVTYI